MVVHQTVAQLVGTFRQGQRGVEVPGQEAAVAHRQVCQVEAVVAAHLSRQEAVVGLEEAAPDLVAAGVPFPVVAAGPACHLAVGVP